MAQKKFKKGDDVVVTYTDGDRYFAKFEAYLADGKKCKVKFADGEILTVPVTDPMLKSEWEDAQKKTEKDKKGGKAGKAGKVEEEPEEVKDSPDLEIENGETIDDEVEELEPEDDGLADMTRSELKKHIADKGLEIKVVKSMTDDDIRDAIRKATAVEDEPEPAEPEEEPEEELEPEPNGDELDELDRSGLKKLIASEGIALTVTKNMTDDTIREKIRELRDVEPAEPEEEPEPEEEEEETDPLVDMDRSGLKKYITSNGLGITVTKSMSDEGIREKIREAEGKKPVDDENEDAPENKVSDEEDDDKWYAVGDEEDEKFKPREYGTFRFFIGKDAKANVTFINEKPFTIKEHELKLNGKYHNYFTCLSPAGKRCPICENGYTPKTVKAFYVIDHTEFKNKKGETVRDQIRLFVLKPKAYKQFKSTIDEHFDGQAEYSYLGLNMVIKRSNDDQSPSSGDIFIVKGKNKFDKKLVKTIDDFKKDFAPHTREELIIETKFAEKDED